MATYVSFYDEKEESFESVKQEFGPEGVELSNPDVVMRLIEFYENHQETDVEGGLTR